MDYSLLLGPDSRIQGCAHVTPRRGAFVDIAIRGIRVFVIEQRRPGGTGDSRSSPGPTRKCAAITISRGYGQKPAFDGAVVALDFIRHTRRHGVIVKG